MSRAASDDNAAAEGLFDFQVNGFGGVDFQSDKLTRGQLREAVVALQHNGAARIFVTLITDTIDRLSVRLRRIVDLAAEDDAADRMIAGFHLEGPWLIPRPGFCGAHPPGPMHAPRLDEFERLQEAARGRVRLVTLAPEWPGSPEFIAALVARGVQVSLGHTDASEGLIDEAIGAGARFCTHLGNGTPGMLPRHDNVTQRLLARDELTACLIPDGIHLPPYVLRNFYRAKPTGKVLFTTDAMAAAGAPPGRYSLGQLQVEVGMDGVVRQPGTDGFAGSALTPAEGVRRTALLLGLSEKEATRIWTESAAAFGVT